MFGGKKLSKNTQQKGSATTVGTIAERKRSANKFSLKAKSSAKQLSQKSSGKKARFTLWKKFHIEL